MTHSVVFTRMITIYLFKLKLYKIYTFRSAMHVAVSHTADFNDNL